MTSKSKTQIEFLNNYLDCIHNGTLKQNYMFDGMPSNKT